MRLRLTIWLLILPLFVFTQTPVSGIVNSYYKVIEVVTPKSCVRVDNAAGLGLNDQVLIIQMKGASISTANSAAFGSVSNLQNAGNYEIGTVCSIRGDSVFLFKQLAQSYTVSDLVQLVRIPQYNSALVTDTLKAASWDNATGKGGVLAISVLDDLILQAPLSANQAGYKGGAYLLSNSTCFNFFPASNYAYDPTVLNPQDGAYKGESVASLPVSQSGGKGAAANGGGGGNNHNNGGGGGANLAAGGLGGGNSSAAGCTVANAGRGGYALSSNSGNKIYLGGGGGAGHANSGTPSTGGGHGGGIIILLVNNLISNGQKIMANGGDGGSTLGDGASGGGAGGTIVMHVNAYIDAPVLEAKGGNGGNENDDNISQRCYAEGGGGSGGTIYFKGSVPAGSISVSGGVKGARLNSLDCATIVVGTNGTAGSTLANYSYVQSTTLSTSCGATLDVQLMSFQVKAAGAEVAIDWQVSGIDELKEFILERKEEGGNWEEIRRIQPITNRFQYSYTDKNLQPGLYFYRLHCLEWSGREVVSSILSARMGIHQLSLYPNPASSVVTIAYPFKKGTELKIFNALGELVIDKKMMKTASFTRIDVSHFRKGMYYVSINKSGLYFSVQ